MRVSPSLRRAAAALCAVLLPFGVPQGGGHAQTSDVVLVRTVTNIAEASWDVDGSRQQIASNSVSFDVTLPPPTINVYRRSQNGSADELAYRAPQCGGSDAPLQQLRANATASQTPSGPAVSAVTTATVEPTDELRGGEPLFFEVTASIANRDSDAIETVTVVLTTPDGDRETMTVFETAADSGVFAGVIDTVRIPPPLVQEDCRLSVGADSRITITALRAASDEVLVTADVTVLVDPFGVVFDSETGEPIEGARVTLLDADTGAPPFSPKMASRLGRRA